MTAPLLVISVDGGDEGVVRSLVSAGRLPCLNAMLEGGTAVSIDTPCDTLELSVWAPLITGQPPGNHALAHFVEFDQATMGLRVRRESDLEPFWLHLPGRGSGVISLDTPEMHPHPASQADEACSWLAYSPAHRPTITSASLRRSLRGMGRRPKFNDPHAVAPPEMEDKLARNLARSIAFKQRAFTSVSRGTHTMCVGFHEPHAVVHWFGHHHRPDHWHRPGPARPELVAQPYEALDRAIGGLREAHRDANVAVILARGIRPGNQSPDLLGPLLERAGLARRRLPGAALEDGSPGPAGGEGGRVLGLARRAIPADVRERLAMKILPERMQHDIMSAAFRDAFDWPHTRAFALPSWDAGLIRINLAGREVAGVVESGDHETVVAEVVTLLRQLEDPDTGLPLIEDVVRPQRLFPGTKSTLMPDVLVTWAGRRPALRARHPRFGTWSAPFREGRWTEHAAPALVLLAGPSVRRAGETVEGNLADLAPTLLALRGARAPSVMTGTVWTDLLTTRAER